MSFTDPFFFKEVTRIINGFVDDTTIWANQFADELAPAGHQSTYSATESTRNLETLVANAQSLAQQWENLLWATGGMLELPKCLYYVLHWYFSPNGQPCLASTAQISPRISLVESATGNTPPIPFLEPHTAHKTLGVMVSPSGSMTAQFSRIA